MVALGRPGVLLLHRRGAKYSRLDSRPPKRAPPGPLPTRRTRRRESCSWFTEPEPGVCSWFAETVPGGRSWVADPTPGGRSWVADPAPGSRSWVADPEPGGRSWVMAALGRPGRDSSAPWFARLSHRFVAAGGWGHATMMKPVDDGSFFTPIERETKAPCFQRPSFGASWPCPHPPRKLLDRETGSGVTKRRPRARYPAPDVV